ncbi:MAG: hypothetical protein LQ349_006733 [Xanthoria aureola]|nr:MAG: hypothetical protein LQ349_006733 [Xanthoria aureola]
MPKRSGRSRPRSSVAATQDESQSNVVEKPRRQITVYDAVAGRISTHGFIPPVQQASKNRDTLSSHHTAVPPEDVLFRRRHAPERYEEDDVYFAHENLSDSQELPDSDLLKAVHTYASDFYGKGLGSKAEVDFRSMDETALMCVGVLLEEYMQKILGDTGDLVFVEAGEEKEGSGNVAAQDANRRKLGFEHEDGRRAEETEELVEQESDEEESPSDTTETEDEHEAPSSSEGESPENGRPRKRAKIVK